MAEIYEDLGELSEIWTQGATSKLAAMRYDDLLRLGAHNLVHDHDPARMDRMILEQMLKLSKKDLMPSWQNYRETKHWQIVQKYLNDQEQFIYRTRYIHWFKETWLNLK